MSRDSQHIVILGGGFGGLYTALRSGEFPKDEYAPKITLVDKNDRFLFSPLLYELVTGEMDSWEIAPPYSELLEDTGIHFQKANVEAIDIDNRLVKLDNGENLIYDRLVIATGGRASLSFVRGAEEHAIPFRTLEDAYRLKDRLRELEAGEGDKIRVAIVGGGYSGVEIACKIADRLGERGRVRIIEKTADILNNSPEYNRKTAREALEKRHIWLDTDTTVEEIRADSMDLNYKGQVDSLPVELVIWTVSPIVSDLIANLPLTRGDRKPIKVNSYLQAVDHPEIYVLGDAADCRDGENKPYPPTAQLAISQADYCAWNLRAGLTDRPLLEFKYQSLGEMMTLGVDEATLSGLGIKLNGNLAYLARRLVYLYRLPTLKHQLNVGLHWLIGPILSLVGE